MSIRKKKIEQQYQKHESLSDLLPWIDWSDENHIVLLEDLFSVGMALEIRDLPSEAQPEENINALFEILAQTFSDLVPLEDDNPWVMQIFCQDDMTLDSLYQRLETYVSEKNPRWPNDPLAQTYLTDMKEHFDLMTREEGFFKDPLSGLSYRGRSRRIRATIYRRYSKLSKNKGERGNQIEELKQTVDSILSKLDAIGISARKITGKSFYDWLVRWFNPNPELTDGNVDELLRRFPYPEEGKPYGWNFTQNIFHSAAESFKKGWVFDDIKHKVLVFKDLQSNIDIGVISREKGIGMGGNKYALLDKFPPGTIYTIQIVYESKQLVEEHLLKIEKAAVGKDLEINEIKSNVQKASYEIANKNMLFRSVEAIYIRGKTEAELNKIERDLKSVLSNSGLEFLDSREEMFPIDTYLRFLPFNFNYAFDKKYTYRSTYKFATHIAKLIPIYGRFKGDGYYPLQVRYNRGGEGITFDPLNKFVKRNNSHGFICGTSGAGKSVLINTMILEFMAVYNARVIYLEIGGSGDHTAEFLKIQDRDVKAIKFTLRKPVPINPYAEAYKTLEKIESQEAVLKAQGFSSVYLAEEQVISESAEKISHLIESLQDFASDEEKKGHIYDIPLKKEAYQEKEGAEEEERDLLNEMVLATRTMLSGGEKKEEEELTRTDNMLITKVLIHAMRKCKDKNYPQMLVQHVYESFMDVSQSEPNPNMQERLKKFGLLLELYIKGIKAEYINRASEAFKDVDFMQVDFGFMQQSTYQDLLNINCISILGKILSLAEEHKKSGRPTVLFLDEAHVFFKSEMVAAFIILMTKVSRKINLWIYPATQNLEDLSGVESRKALSMLETYYCLSLNAAQIELLNQFKPLTPEMRALLLDMQKVPGLYSEGVILGENYKGLFRNIPPRTSLALALTDPDERAHLARIQEEQGFETELETVLYIAEQMKLSVKANNHLNEVKFI